MLTFGVCFCSSLAAFSARQCESRTWYPVCYSTQTSTKAAERAAKRCPTGSFGDVLGFVTRCSHRMTMLRASFRAHNAATTRWPKRTKFNHQTSTRPSLSSLLRRPLVAVFLCPWKDGTPTMQEQLSAMGVRQAAKPDRTTLDNNYSADLLHARQLCAKVVKI